MTEAPEGGGQAPSKRRTPFYKKLLLAILSPLIALALIEGGLRLFGSLEAERDVHDLLYGDTPLGINPGLFVEDPELGWRARAGADFGPERKINESGFRGPDRAEAKPAGTTRIACLGDSVTFGWSQLESETYSAVLQSLLDRGGDGRRFEVMNFGVPGYTTHQGRQILESDVLRYSPDVVTLLFGWNDTHHSSLRRPDRERPKPSAVATALHDTLGWSRIYQMLRRFAVRLAAGEGGAVKQEGEAPQAEIDPSTVRVPMAHFLENLESIVRTCREHEIQPVLVTEPHNAKYIDYPLQEEYVRAVRAGAREADVPLADFERIVRRRYLSTYVFAFAQLLRPVAPRAAAHWMELLRISRMRGDAEMRGEAWSGPPGVADRELFIDDVHPNKEGHLLLAYTLYETLRSALWPELPPRSPVLFVNLGQVPGRDALIDDIVGEGWGPLPTGTWEWWRPIEASRATLNLLLPKSAAPARLRLRVRSVASGPRALELELGGERSRSFSVPREWTVIEWAPSENAWSRDVLTIDVQGATEHDANSGLEVASLLVEQDFPLPLPGGGPR
ncbi:MAG: GDSL-type esterase/lipase family protein [Planctomycetota bacterium]